MSMAQVIFPPSPVTEPITASIQASSLATLSDRSCLPFWSTTQTSRRRPFAAGLVMLGIALRLARTRTKA